MIIGVITRPSLNEFKKNMYSIYETINNAIINSSGITLGIVPNIYFKEELIQDFYKLKVVLDLCDGFILQGGSELYPYDKQILAYLYQTKKPVLAICLSMQLMGEFLKGNIVKIHKQNHYNVNHNVIINPNSKLFEIIQKKIIMVNSRHQYMLENIEATALSDNGVIEAIEDKHHPFFVGIQWHPENLIEIDEISKKLFDRFIQLCKGD